MHNLWCFTESMTIKNSVRSVSFAFLFFPCWGQSTMWPFICGLKNYSTLVGLHKSSTLSPVTPLRLLLNMLLSSATVNYTFGSFTFSLVFCRVGANPSSDISTCWSSVWVLCLFQRRYGEMSFDVKVYILIFLVSLCITRDMSELSFHWITDS